MTRDRAKELLPIIKAYSEGKEIEICIMDEWMKLIHEPLFDSDSTYRIKPTETKYENDKELPDCKFNYGHIENGKWIKKKCHVNCECEFATFGICNDVSDLKGK